jgi:hypothetical protein
MKNQSATPAVSPQSDAVAALPEVPEPQPQVVTPADPQPRDPLLALKGSAARCRHDVFCIDLLQEGANMLELRMRQSRCLTPLSISSRAAQAILNQF